VKRVERSGVWYRVCKPDWVDCTDTTFSRTRGGRWNAPGTFGVLYLNETVEVAVARVHAMFRSGEATVFDLRPERRPELLELDLPARNVADAVSDEGLRALDLPANYPFAVDHDRCQPIGARVYADVAMDGVVYRSAAGCEGPGQWQGEELALFDRAASDARPVRRRPFDAWYGQR
jgi:RES domain-containing protein